MIMQSGSRRPSHDLDSSQTPLTSSTTSHSTSLQHPDRLRSCHKRCTKHISASQTLRLNISVICSNVTAPTFFFFSPGDWRVLLSRLEVRQSEEEEEGTCRLQRKTLIGVFISCTGALCCSDWTAASAAGTHTKRLLAQKHGRFLHRLSAGWWLHPKSRLHRGGEGSVAAAHAVNLRSGVCRTHAGVVTPPQRSWSLHDVNTPAGHSLHCDRIYVAPSAARESLTNHPTGFTLDRVYIHDIVLFLTRRSSCSTQAR